LEGRKQFPPVNVNQVSEQREARVIPFIGRWFSVQGISHGRASRQ
jgi:hypothetical protein